MSRTLVANIGAEEGAVAPAARDAVDTLACLWRWLFGAAEQMIDASGQPIPERPLPEALGAAAQQAALPGLGALPDPIAWWPGDPSLHAMHSGVPAEFAYAVHDKGFAQAFAEAEGYVPRSLRGLVRVLEVAELSDEAGAEEILRRHTETWPDWTAGAFTLKPRIGTSGRGRVRGDAKRIGDPAAEWRGALRRLAARGGAVLEPWLERVDDASCQVLIEPDASVSLLGTLRLLTSSAGVYRGHAGEIDSRGRVFSGIAWEETLREAGAALAAESARRGFRGPCGLDAFSFHAGDAGVQVRSVVEWNARFTTGTVVLGLLRRALPVLKDRLSLAPGERRAFYFALSPPPDGWERVGAALGDAGLALPLGDFGTLAPGLLFGPDRETLEAALAGSATAARTSADACP